MITDRQLATVRAALRYWQEEMCPHDESVMRPYLERPDIEPLTSDEVEVLRQQFVPDAVRYGIYDRASQRLADQGLFVTVDEAVRSTTEEMDVVTVLLPIQPRQPGGQASA